MPAAGDEDVEILVHIAAPSTARDDDIYRRLATDYLSFQPRSRRAVYRPDDQSHDVPPQTAQRSRSTLPIATAYSSSVNADSQGLPGQGEGQKATKEVPRLLAQRTTALTGIRRKSKGAALGIVGDGSIKSEADCLPRPDLEPSGDAPDMAGSSFLSFRSVEDNRGSPRLATKVFEAQMPATPPDVIVEVPDSQVHGSKVSDSQQSSLISEIPDSNPNTVFMPELNSPGRVMEHFLTGYTYSRSLRMKEAPRVETPPSPVTPEEEQEPQQRGQEDSAMMDDVSVVEETILEGDSRAEDESRSRLRQDGERTAAGANPPEMCSWDRRRERRASSPFEPTTSPTRPSFTRKRRREEEAAIAEPPRLPRRTADDSRKDGEIDPKRKEGTTSADKPPPPTDLVAKRRKVMDGGVPGDSPRTISRADSEPLPARRPPGTSLARSVALNRSASDQLQQQTAAAARGRHATSTIAESQATNTSSSSRLPIGALGGFLLLDDTLAVEVLPPPPTPSLATVEPAHLVTPNLARLAADLDLGRRYRPCPATSRALRPFERGYWRVECGGGGGRARGGGSSFRDGGGWDEVSRREAWAFLAHWVGKGLAGWGTRCWRDAADARASMSSMRLYCFGHVAPHAYLLLYLASRRKTKYADVYWIDGGGEVAVKALARS